MTNTPDTIAKYLNELQLHKNGWTYRGRTYAYSGEDIVTQLTHFLYTEWYSKKESYTGKDNTYPTASDVDFVSGLSDRNSTTEKTETGWIVTAVYPSAVATIQRGKQIRSVNTRHIINPSGASIILNQPYSILFPKEDRNLQQGFYYVYSDEYFISDGAMFRAYWNINSDGAASLVASVTEVLNRYYIPFIFKCLDHPALYYRRDAAVLYFNSRYLGLVRRLLPEISAKISSYLQADVPLFTFRHSAGVGLAENPSSNESFGMHRMRLIAESLLDAGHSGSRSTAISATFASAGLHINTPYLNNGTVNLFN